MRRGPSGLNDSFRKLLTEHGYGDRIINAWELDISSLDVDDATALKRLMNENHLFVPNTEDDAEKFEKDNKYNESPFFARDEVGRLIGLFISQGEHFSGHVDMSGFSWLRYLWISSWTSGDKKGITLDVRRNISLRALNCSICGLEVLDVSRNHQLEYLDCAVNKLSDLDLSSNIKLSECDCSFNNIEKLDVSHNIGLKHLNCRNNNLKQLDISHNIDLLFINCEDNLLNGLDLSFNEHLEDARFGNSFMISVFDSKQLFDHAGRIALLKDTELHANRIKHVDLSKNRALKVIACGGLALRSLDVSGLAALEALYCADNALTHIDVSHNTKLSILSCESNDLAEIDVTSNKRLENLFCGRNLLANLDVRHNQELLYLDFSNDTASGDRNRIQEIDLSHNCALKSLICRGVGLRSLDVRHNTQLEVLVCSRNELTKLNVENNAALKELVCGNGDDPKGKNRFGTLYLAKNPELEHLSCTTCGLRVLDISENPKLASLECYGNDLKDVDTSHNPKLKPEKYHIKTPASKAVSDAIDATVDGAKHLVGSMVNSVSGMASDAASTIIDWILADYPTRNRH